MSPGHERVMAYTELLQASMTGSSGVVDTYRLNTAQRATLSRVPNTRAALCKCLRDMLGFVPRFLVEMESLELLRWFAAIYVYGVDTEVGRLTKALLWLLVYAQGTILGCSITQVLAAL